MEKGSKKHMHTHSNLTVKIVWVCVFLGFDTLQITIKTKKKQTVQLILQANNYFRQFLSHEGHCPYIQVLFYGKVIVKIREWVHFKNLFSLTEFKAFNMMNLWKNYMKLHENKD